MERWLVLSGSLFLASSPCCSWSFSTWGSSQQSRQVFTFHEIVTAQCEVHIILILLLIIHVYTFIVLKVHTRHTPPSFHFHFPKFPQIPNFQARKSTCRDASYAHILLLVVLVFILCQSPRLFLNFWEIFLDKCAQTQFGPPVWYEVSQGRCWRKLTLPSIHWMIPGLPFEWSKKSAVS